MTRTDLAALVVTYFPDSSLPRRIDALLEQFDRVLLIDNGSDEASLLPLTRFDDNRGVTLHRNSSNLGIATALNQGLRILASEGFNWVLTLDQDSTIRPRFASSLLNTLRAHRDQKSVALIGSNRIDHDNGIVHRWLRPRSSFPFFERVPCERAFNGVTLVITSGTMTNISAFNHLGGFREEMFIDLVDFEYCLRARQHGYSILVSCGAELIHKVGDKSRQEALGIQISSTHHSPLRKYYLFRNSIFLIRKYGRAQPHWLIYHLLSLGEVLLGILLSEREKLPKFHACLAGIVDGLANKNGPCGRDWNRSFWRKA